MKKTLYILFALVFSNSYSQNLIYNGDFEIYDTCPNNLSQPGDYQIEKCLGWYAPTYATSDYFNSCATWPVSVPNNAIGNILPYSGNAYCGIFIEDCKNINLCSSYWGFWVEYIQSKLIMQLSEGHEYEFTCKVARTNKAADYAFSEFGAIFSSDSIIKNDARPILNTPQVINQRGHYLSDTNWMEIKGKFIARGDENFITIGFFLDTLNLDTLNVANNWIIDPLHYGTYYFIDDAKLQFTGNIFQFPNIFSPNNDGINDVWKPFFSSYGDVLKIYNRWGALVFENESTEIYWDGRNKSSENCAPGAYYFVIENPNGNRISGNISLTY